MTTPAPERTYDLFVIGGGTAGLVGAKAAAALGASVLLVERGRLGGDCLWTGCVPSKSLLASAAAAAGARRAGRLGIGADVTVDGRAVLAHVRDAMATIAPTDSAEALEAAGVEVRLGSARFTGHRSAAVDGTRVRFDQALVATGSHPVVPDLPGLSAADPLTSDTLWDLTDLPGRVAVLGGGSIGCELAQALARLGVAVSIVEAAPRLLGREDAAAAALVQAALEADGVDVRTGAAVESVTGGALVLDGGDRVSFERVLVAVGRAASADAGLDAAGVARGERGTVIVDDALRTTNDHVWAAGDVTGHPQFTHLAGVHGTLAATNAVLGLRRTIDGVVPRVTFTSPEVAAVGVATDEPPPGVTVREVPARDVDRAVAEDETAGFARVAVDRRGTVVGATVVGPRAGESLAELTLAVRRGLKARDLAGTTHPYPTFGDGVWSATVADVQARLASPPARLATGALLRFRRWRDSR